MSTLVLIKRSLKHIFLNSDQLIGLVVQPIMFMLLFRYVFGGAITPPGMTYTNFLVPGILVQMAAFGATTTSLSVAMDMKSGFIDRVKSLPISGWGVIMGHVTADLVRNLVSTMIMIGVALIVGFRPEASFIQWVEIVGIILLFTFAISWVFAIIGLIAKSVEAVQWMGFLIIFPLTFASPAFAPTETMVPAVRAFADNQPIAHVIKALRNLMNGMPAGEHAWMTLLWFGGITIIAIPIAMRLFRNHSGR